MLRRGQCLFHALQDKALGVDGCQTARGRFTLTNIILGHRGGRINTSTFVVDAPLVDLSLQILDLQIHDDFDRAADVLDDLEPVLPSYQLLFL